MLNIIRKNTPQTKFSKHKFLEEVHSMISLWLFWIAWGIIWMAESMCIILKEGFSPLLLISIPFSAGFFILFVQSVMKAKHRADQ